MKKLLVTLILITLFAISCNEENCNCNDEQINFPDLLLNVESSIYADLNSINGILSLGAYRIATSDLSEGSICKELLDIIAVGHHITESNFIDANGILKYIEPKEFKEYEGSDISNQAHVIKLHETLQPVLSDLFLAVEGFYSVDMAYPIIKDNNLLGSLSLLLTPAEYIASIIEPKLQGREEEIMIIQLDGIVIYDQDAGEIGKNVLTDPSYQQFTGLIETGQKVIANSKGETEYSYYKADTEETVKKKAYWRTLEYYGTQWRIMIAIPMD